MMQELKQNIAEIKDFPKPGILFRDISPLLKFKFREAIDAMSQLFSENEWSEIQLIAGIESRGFIFASALAYKYSKGMVKIRKPGKLPMITGKMAYQLEYGESFLEMQQGSGEKIVIVDDLIATGGSMKAAAQLVQQVGYQLMGMAAFINLTSLHRFNYHGMICRSVIDY